MIKSSKPNAEHPHLVGDDLTDECRSKTTALKTDTGIAKALAGGICVEDEKPKNSGANPYNDIKRMDSHSPVKPKRRSLDDMRRLSEQIKSAKATGTKS